MRGGWGRGRGRCREEREREREREKKGEREREREEGGLVDVARTGERPRSSGAGRDATNS